MDLTNTEISLLSIILTYVSTRVSDRIRLRLRKEPFKQFLYQRQFAVYEQLVTQLSHICLMCVAVEKAGSDEKSLFYKKSLLDHLTKCKTIIEGTAHLLPERIFRMYHEVEELVAPIEVPDATIPMAVINKYFDIVNAVREDLGVDKLSEDIKKML